MKIHEITITEVNNIPYEQNPCYENVDYDDYLLKVGWWHKQKKNTNFTLYNVTLYIFFQIISSKIMESVNCSVPFMPQKFFNNLPLCQDPIKGKFHV